MMVTRSVFISAVRRRGQRLSLACLALLALSPLQADETENPSDEAKDDWSVRQGIDDVTQEYLSDRRRAGSLAGGLLGGALMAHPAGTLVGSIAGFFLGKATHHDDPTASKADQWQQSRRFAPTEPDAETPVLTLSDPDADTLAWDRPTPAPAGTRQGLADPTASPSQSAAATRTPGNLATSGERPESSNKPVIQFGLPPAGQTTAKRQATQPTPPQVAESPTSPGQTACDRENALADSSRHIDCDAYSRQDQRPQAERFTPIHWVHPDYR